MKFALFALFIVISCASFGQDNYPKKIDLGQPASKIEIKLWDTDIKPDGHGLPTGKGTVAKGRGLFNTKCLMCHGYQGKNGTAPTLVGRMPNDEFNFGNNRKLVRTIGNYWPYATTLYDYIWRAMPQISPGSLSANEVYSITAYLLYLNAIVPKSIILDSQTLPKIQMPSHDKFFIEN